MGEESKDGCCESEQQCGCEGQCNCAGSECCESDMLDTMMYIAHKAKFELLKDKIKKKLEASDGKKLDQIADIVVEGLLESKKDKAQMQKKMQELRERLDSVLNG